MGMEIKRKQTGEERDGQMWTQKVQNLDMTNADFVKLLTTFLCVGSALFPHRGRRIANILSANKLMPSCFIIVFPFLPAEIPNGCPSSGKSISSANYSTSFAAITADYSPHTPPMSACTNTVASQPPPRVPSVDAASPTAEQRSGNGAAQPPGHSHFQSLAAAAASLTPSAASAHTHKPAAAARKTSASPAVRDPLSQPACGSSPTEQFTSRHGSEHIGAAHDRLGFSANSNSHLNSDQSQASPATAKCSNVSVNSKSGASKIVLQKYYKVNSELDGSTGTTVNSSTVSCDEQSSTLNASNFSANDSSHSTRSDRGPSKRNSLNLLAARSFEAACGRMVAMQEIPGGDANSYSFDDPSEELQYGPGIVSKLRCRYLSLALRQSAAKQRPSLDNLRRTTSLNNLLDEDEEDVDEVDDDSGRDSNGHPNSFDETDKNAWNGGDARNHMSVFAKSKLIIGNGCEHKTTDATQLKRIRFNDAPQSNGKPPIAPANGKIYETPRRQSQRGNDSLKRARSVEALMRYDTLAWRRDQLNDSEEYPSSNPIILDELIVTESTMVKTKTAQDITIEDKIQQARERNSTKAPKKLTSFMDETERPPPDLVKQTLLKFEASVNRRPRGGLHRYGNGDVASKVATYKSKLSIETKQTSQAVSASSPTSPVKKPTIKPRTTSPKPITLNGLKIIAATNGKPAGVELSHIRSSLEHRSAPRVHAAINNVMAYRSAKPDSPTSPESPQPRMSAFDVSLIKRAGDAVHSLDSPTMNSLAHRTECLSISTPKARPLSAQLNGGRAEESAQDSDNDDQSSSSSNGCTGSYDVNGSSDNNDNDSDGSDKKFVLNKKRVSKRALESISTAGLSTKFAFDSTGSSSAPLPSKSYLPVINSVSSSRAAKQTNGSDAPEPSVRQIGIIRPLMNEQKPPAPPIPPVRTILSPTAAAVNGSDAIKVSVMPSATTIVATQAVILSPSAPGTTASVVVTSSSTGAESSVVVVDCGSHSRPSPPLRAENLLITTNVIATTPSMLSPALSPIGKDCASNGSAHSIVQQKNQINKEKSGEDATGKTSSLMIQLPMKWNGGSKSSSAIITSSPIVTNPPQSAPPSTQAKGRAQAEAQPNTMVFNFSNRKEVPDYIENDGLVIRRKIELPKVSWVTGCAQHRTSKRERKQNTNKASGFEWPRARQRSMH